MPLKWILLLSSLFTFTIGHSLYSMIDKWSGAKYDCLYGYLDPDFFESITRKQHTKHRLPVQQISPYCIAVNHSIYREELCVLNDGISWSFEQLHKLNVTSYHLVGWNAPVHIIDEYERYLQNGDNESEIFHFCNCSSNFAFGIYCQYAFQLAQESFDTILKSYFYFERSTFLDSEITQITDADMTCYKRDSSCFSGCLDWRQICNGIIDCNDGYDEKECELLEFNECHENEYRCRSGHCIPLLFSFDTNFDCADGSDETDYFMTEFDSSGCFRYVPNMYCDDSNNAWMKYPCGDGYSIPGLFFSCPNARYILGNSRLFTDDSTPCSRYMLCIHEITNMRFPYVYNVTGMCNSSIDYSSLLHTVCPESTVFFPSKSLLSSPSVYFAYLTNRTKGISSFMPDFFCYAECDHIYPPTSEHHGYSCRTLTEFTSEFIVFPELSVLILSLFTACNNKTNISNNSYIFRCPITNKPISYHRVKDGFKDCLMGSDEVFNGANCIPNSNQQFRCWTTSDQCIAIRLVQNDKPDCPDKSDEFYNMNCYDGGRFECDYKRGLYKPAYPYYAFQNICDGYITEPSLLPLINGTDETDCGDFLCSASPSIRCNGYWECIDGHDELNCSLDLLPAAAKSTKLLQILNDCNATEHFCLHISNRSSDTSRSCISVSLVGDGHVDCWGAADERHSFCDYRQYIDGLSRLTYACDEKGLTCTHIRNACNADYYCPLKDGTVLCNWLSQSMDVGRLQCRDGAMLVRDFVQCNGQLDCADGEDEWFCDLDIRGPRRLSLHELPVAYYPAYLENETTTSTYRDQSPIVPKYDAKTDWFCNRGIPVIDSQSRRCLCPSNYFGDRCENQRERISVVIKIVSSSLLRQDSAIKLVVYLVDMASLKILVDEEILHFPYTHSLFKHFVLLPSARAQYSFVRIDWYEINIQQIIGYRTSWKFHFPFNFLPVRRLAVHLFLPNKEEISFPPKLTCHTCVHGQCSSYQNSDDTFCRCYNGWTGIACNESFSCALGAVSLNSHRCLCPMNRYGTRCFIPNIAVCHCLNGATCLPVDARSRQSACLCSENYFGRYCEKQSANLTIQTFDIGAAKILPVLLIQFIRITSTATMAFENTFLFEGVSTNRALIVHHVDYEYLPAVAVCKIFYSSSNDNYELYIILHIPMRKSYPGSNVKSVETQLETRQKCSDVRKMETFKKLTDTMAYPHIKRIKYYIRACAENNISCFYDEIYLCFCTIQMYQLPFCAPYDHAYEKCMAPNYCLHEGLCVENRRKERIEFTCLCQSCHYYGPLCQFSIGRQGLSLDSLLGIAMKTGKHLAEQSLLIKTTMIVLIIMITFGLIGNLLCIKTFAQKNSRATGSGYYLFLMSIYNLMALLILGLRFAYLVVTQTTIVSNRRRSLIICQCLEFGLVVLPNLSNWLSACVSVERACVVAYGVIFHKQKSIRVAKLMCLILLMVTAGFAVHESVARELIEDPRLGRFTWCVTKYSSNKSQTIATLFSITNLLGPFIVNLVSMSVLIMTLTRKKLVLKKDKSYQQFLTALYQQIRYYKHFIISPMILLLLTLPRLIITLGSLCIDTSWRNYMFLAGYFISFAPLMGTLLIFIIPSPIYRHELTLYLKQSLHMKLSYDS